MHSVRGGLFARPVQTKEDKDAIEFIEGNKRKYVGISAPLGVYEQVIAEEGGAMITEPPAEATCACALGAMALTPKLTNPLTYYAMTGNDASPRSAVGDKSIEYTYADVRSMQIGAAYEQALRPD